MPDINKITPQTYLGLHQPDIFETHALATELVNFSIRHYSQSLCKYLIVFKQLPPFYFYDAAQEMDIPKQVYRNWRVHRWPDNDYAADTKSYHTTTEVLLKVLLRICSYPEEETYPAAVGRLKTRVRELIAKSISHNRVAQHLHMSHNSLTEMISNEPRKRRRPRHCPWHLLARLEDAEEEIVNRPHRREEALRVPMDTYIQVPLPPQHRNFKFITRHSPCGHCDAPWHNLKSDGEDAYGNIMYICAMCFKISRIAPATATPQPAAMAIRPRRRVGLARCRCPG